MNIKNFKKFAKKPCNFQFSAVYMKGFAFWRFMEYNIYINNNRV